MILSNSSIWFVGCNSFFFKYLCFASQFFPDFQFSNLQPPLVEFPLFWFGANCVEVFLLMSYPQFWTSGCRTSIFSNFSEVQIFCLHLFGGFCDAIFSTISTGGLRQSKFFNLLRSFKRVFLTYLLCFCCSFSQFFPMLCEVKIVCIYVFVDFFQKNSTKINSTCGGRKSIFFFFWCGADVHGHVYVRVVQKLHSGSYSWRKYTSAHQSLLLGETELRYQGCVTLTAVSEELSTK